MASVGYVHIPDGHKELGSNTLFYITSRVNEYMASVGFVHIPDDQNK
jgi:N-acetylglutamate synthase-like GNAT family acetyltransferase